MLSRSCLGLLGRSPRSIHRYIARMSTVTGGRNLPRNTHSGGICLAGFPNGANSPHSGGLYVIHLSRVCLGTTRTNLGVKNRRTAGKVRCLGSIVAGHAAGATVGMGTTTSFALRHVLGREEGRLINRNLTICSCAHGGLPIIHGKD